MKKLKEINNKYVKIRFIACLILVTNLLSSCTVITKEIDNPINYDENVLDIGSTHYSDVIDILGPPSKISRHNKGLVFLYESIFISENQLGISTKHELIKWFKFSYARGNADRQVLFLIFDRTGILTRRHFKEFGEELGSGQSLSVIFSVDSLVDLSRLEEEPDTLDWGISLLKPLPEVLNTPNNLKTGNVGIEQLGAPNSVGQHTLEMED